MTKKSKLNHGMIVLLEFFPSWLALSRENRRMLANDLYSIIDKYSEHVKVKFFDADALGMEHILILLYVKLQI